MSACDTLLSKEPQWHPLGGLKNAHAIIAMSSRSRFYIESAGEPPSCESS